MPQDGPNTQYAELRWGEPRRARARRPARARSARACCCAPAVWTGRGEHAARTARARALAPIRSRRVWRDDAYEPPAEVERLADAAVEGLRERGSPAHDGMATRLAALGRAATAGCALELQPVRWALRLLEDASRQPHRALRGAHRGRPLARRAAAPAGCRRWASRWALGAGGAVDLGESPAETLTRELQEEWQLEPRRPVVEALRGPAERAHMLVGLATVAGRCEPVPDARARRVGLVARRHRRLAAPRRTTASS